MGAVAFCRELVVAIVAIGFLIGFPWLNPGYRFLSLAITTGITAIALYGLGHSIRSGRHYVRRTRCVHWGGRLHRGDSLAVKLGAGFWVALPFSMALSAGILAGLDWSCPRCE